MASSTRTAEHARKATPTRVRKNINIDPVKLARARKALGTVTDTETVDQALDAIVFAHEQIAALERLAAAGGLADALGREVAVKRARRGEAKPATPSRAG